MATIVPISTQCACLDDDGNAWIFSNEVNALFFMKFNDNFLKYITSFEQEEELGTGLYTDAIWFRGKIFFIPCQARNIAVYDTENSSVKYIPLEQSGICYNVVSAMKNTLLLYPAVYSKDIYLLDLESECYDHFFADYGEQEEFIKRKVLRGKAYCKGKAHFVIDKTNRYVSFDLETRAIEINETSRNDLLFQVASDEQYLYMMRADGCAYDVYDENVYISTCYLDEQSKIDSNDFKFDNMKYVINTIVNENIVVSIPMKKQAVCVLEAGKLRKIKLDDTKIENYIDELQPLYVCKHYENKLILFPYHGKTIVYIDLKTDRVIYKAMDGDVSLYNLYKIMGEKFLFDSDRTWVADEKRISLNEFLNCVKRNPSYIKSVQEDILIGLKEL